MTPLGVANLDPKAGLAVFMQETIQHCYILNMLPLGILDSKKKTFEGSLAI